MNKTLPIKVFSNFWWFTERKQNNTKNLNTKLEIEIETLQMVAAHDSRLNQKRKL